MKISYCKPGGEPDNSDILLSPHHPVLEIDRVELEDPSKRRSQQILSVKVKDGELEKDAVIHVSIGIKKGRVFTEVSTRGASLGPDGAGVVIHRTTRKTVSSNWIKR